MSWVIRLIGTPAGERTEFDGGYVKAYDPTYVLPGGEYDGGILEVCEDPQDALLFKTLKEAVRKYKQPWGFRLDGERNRPLTAWSAEFIQYPEGIRYEETRRVEGQP